MWKRDVPHAPTVRLEPQDPYAPSLSEDLPVKTAAGTIRCHDKRVAVSRRLGFPIVDHPEPEAANLDVVEYRKAVVDGRTGRTSHESRLVIACRLSVRVDS